MAWLIVTDKGCEAILRNKPIKKENSFYSWSGELIYLTNGTIEKIIGRKITFSDEPVEI